MPNLQPNLWTTEGLAESRTIQFEQNNDAAEAFRRFLKEEGTIEQPILDRAVRASRTSGERLDRVLAKLGLVSETDLAAAWSRHLCIPLITPADLPTAPLLPEVATPEFIRRNRLMPLAITATTLRIGLIDPLHVEPAQALGFLTRREVEPRLFIPADFDRAYEALYGRGIISDADTNESAGRASEVDIQRLRDMASEAPTIKLVNQIIANAVECKASDVHIEPEVDSVLVRYRIDGLLRAAQTLPSDTRAVVTSRIKIMARLDIAERRLPQDGRIRVVVRGVDIDFRVSTIPTVYGESVVLRILDRSRIELDFAKLGFDSADIASLQSLLQQPNGIFLVTGPTGSGKTTTLYTALKTLNSADRKLMSVEDPIEYQLTHVNQVQVQPGIGLDFPHALRSILRQDPDIIMIGEIRDTETARIAIQASLTGHLVLSTLHTNAAAAAITRLIDMGVESYLLASTVKAVLAQRLVRRLCHHCSRPVENGGHWLAQVGVSSPSSVSSKEANVRAPRGCQNCGHTGFSGRTTISELLHVNAQVHRHLLAGGSETAIADAARTQGMRTMYESGLAKVWRGETTIEEVLRVTRVA
jgi:general secretion pathway protein E